MKKLDLSQITGSTGMPLKKGTLLHIVESQREVLDALMRGLVNYTTGNVIVIYGCAITGTNPGVISNTAGAVYYNGEVYLVDAQTFSTTGSNIPCWTIVETSVSGLGYDTVLLTDASIGYIHKDRKFKLVNGPIGGSGIANYVCDYNSTVVAYFNEVNYVTNTFTLTTSQTQTITSKQISIDKVGRNITLHFIIEFTFAGAGGSLNDTFIITVPKYQNLTNGGKFGVANLIKIVAPGSAFIRTATCQSLNNGTIVVSMENAWTNGEQYKLQGAVSYAI